MDRFWNKVDKSNNCWLWTAGRDTGGYGQFRYNNKNVKAHRMSYYLKHEVWPKSLKHSCGNILCVNIEHLLEVEDKQTTAATGSKLSKQDVIDIKKELKTPYWGQIKQLAYRYGVTHSQISHIKSGLSHGGVSID